MNRRSLFAFASVGVVALIACGGEAPPPSSPPKSGGARDMPAEPQSVEEAQQQIAQAADELSGRSMNLKAEKPKSDGKPGDASKTPTTPPAAEPSPARTEDASSDSFINRCESPCRALASMKRAVEALCRMTGETDTKCVDARKTLADNVGKTSSCKCSS